MKEFTLVVTEHDILVLSKALGDVAYSQVAPLIAKLDQQLKSQQSQPEKPNATIPATPGTN